MSKLTLTLTALEFCHFGEAIYYNIFSLLNRKELVTGKWGKTEGSRT